MSISEILYKTKTASSEDILSHLKECDKNFILLLEKRVNLDEYSKKLFNNSVTFEAWADNILVGLIGAYFNDESCNTGYISNVSVINTYLGLGIASKLMEMCIKYAQQNKFKDIKLEVNKDSEPAIQFYKKYCFIVFEVKEEFISMKLKLKN